MTARPIPTTANDVANAVIARTRKKGKAISNLELQKLVYYCQAWFLALVGRPMFDDRIEAGVHGPVVRRLYARFKRYGWSAITEPVADPILPSDVSSMIDEVLKAYGNFSPWELENLTHNEDPWIIARGGLPPDAECQRAIKHEHMAQYYSARARG